MRVLINREDFIYDVKTYLNIYFPNEDIICSTTESFDKDFQIQIEEDHIHVIYFAANEIKYSAYSNKEQNDTILGLNNALEKRKAQKRLMKILLHDVSYKITGIQQPWGILTGIRPTKVVFKLMQQYSSNKEKVKTVLKDVYQIQDEKADLLLEVAEKESAIINQNQPEEVNVYIGIPFCPSKCLYCSFTSYPIDKWKDQVEAYLNALNKEILYVSKQLNKGLKTSIRTIYIGGGTPTSLDEKSLERLLLMVREAFELDQIQEYTVEAGRPDTITEEKLKSLKKYGVNRISINPQTMNQKTLETIGRIHTPEDIVKAYELAETIGFETINMDLIVGLPGETLEDVSHTLSELQKMAPNNITVHTMAYKRGSRLLEQAKQYQQTDAVEIGKMIDLCRNKIMDMGLEPYYLYRQKHMVGNFENVGYAKKGHEGIYNIEIMEEKSNIIAFGVGGVSKVVLDHGNKIERIENLKDITGYINRIDEIIERKSVFFRS